MEWGCGRLGVGWGGDGVRKGGLLIFNGVIVFCASITLVGRGMEWCGCRGRFLGVCLGCWVLGLFVR